MNLTTLKKNQSAANVLRRLREKAELTTRQAAGIIGVTHTTISQFENGKRDLTGYRVEELVKAYGYTMDQFHKILGHKSVISYKDDCLKLIERLDDEQLAAVRAIIAQLLRQPLNQNVEDPKDKESFVDQSNA
jgi:transcriptional regulator with XRE-family HTH domain